MKKIDVNVISKKYEQLHKKYEKNSMKDERFFAINNAMIFSYFVILNNYKYDGNNFEKCYKLLEKKYGMSLFFYNVKKTNTYKTILADATNVFYELFDTQDQYNNSIESLLGNVLEKHINQKDTGSYYTPFDTTEYISWNAIIVALLNKIPNKIQIKICKHFEIELFSELLNSEYKNEGLIREIKEQLTKNEIKEIIETLYSIRIIDPTCGSGAFIITALHCMEKILETIGEQDIQYNRLLDCFYGVDISKEAIHLTKLRLILRIANKQCNMLDFNVMFNKHFIVADTLKGNDYVIKEPGFDWTSFKTKFDCVIGNPPYIEEKYVSDNFITNTCGNLYAYTIERACNIVKEGSVIALIVPLPFVATPRMNKAKEYLEKNSKAVYYSTFADRPGCIFTGVHQRLTIFFAEIGYEMDIKRYSSSYNYWYNSEREELFQKIQYINNPYAGILPKVGKKIELDLYRKLKKGSNVLEELFCEESNYPLYLSTRIGFWAKAFRDNVFSSKEYKTYYAKSDDDLYLALAILNSSTYYYLWVITSDCWHITNKNLSDLTFNIDALDSISMKSIKKTVIELMNDLEKNKKYIGSKQTEYEYKHKYSKEIIDKLDDLLSPIFGFTKKELDYTKKFTQKYRVNTLED